MALILSQLYEHPLKSARGNLVDSVDVRSEGLALDRRFLVHTADGTFISGRSHPRLVKLSVHWDEVNLTLTAQGHSPLIVQPSLTRPSSVAVWKDRFPAWDQGDQAASWLSKFLGDEVRLAWLGQSQRPLRWDRDRAVTFADAAPLLAIGTASLADLSRRVGEELSMRRFRPNLVIEGSEPYEEDTWRRFRVGEVEFLNLDGCGRCEFTTIDPETAERHPQGEPVRTLEAFRKTDTGIYFGMNLMPLTLGTVRVGERVEVLERRTPLFFGADLVQQSLPAVWPNQEVPLICLAIREEAPGVKTFTWRASDLSPLSWRAGQYLTLRFDLPEGSLRRSYTISSPPGSPLEITVKRLDKGRVSNWIHQSLQIGTSVIAEAIGGSFTLEDHSWPSVLFLGAGSGMTPLMAMVRDLARRHWPVEVALYQCARTSDDLLFSEELEELRRGSGSRLTLGSRLTSGEGRLDHQALVKFCPDLRDRRVFVCGPAGYRASVRGLLAGAGCKVDRRYHEELFGEAALDVPEDAIPGTVNFQRTGKSVSSDGKTTLLQLAERSGIDLPSSCRSGDCGTCRVRTSAGEWVLACHTFPRGDLNVDL